MPETPVDLVQRTLEMLVLKTLALESMHGYGIALGESLHLKRKSSMTNIGGSSLMRITHTQCINRNAPTALAVLKLFHPCAD